jgi:hypothetical protein
VKTFVGLCVNRDCRGPHLSIDAGNRGAEDFFTEMGFERYPGVLDDGVSGKVRVTGGSNAAPCTLYMVMTLW